jgi:hypothetical protein
VLPSELAARLAVAAGLRNVLAHEYAAIDLGLSQPQCPLPGRTFAPMSRRSPRTSARRAVDRPTASEIETGQRLVPALHDLSAVS